MITVKEAAQRAADYCQQFYPDAQDIMLEEVERDEQDKFWLTTLSFLSSAAKQNIASPTESVVTQLGSIFPRGERRYKTIKINAANGDFISMKIRELQS